MRSPTSRALVLLAALLGSASLAPADEARRPNVLFLAIDDLRPELRSFGVEHIESPHIDRLAAAGRPFHRHYVQAPTCGASRFALLTGRYGPPGNDALFQRSRRIAEATPSLPSHLRTHGYTTIAIGKVSHHPGGRGGPDWNDPTRIEMPDSWSQHLAPSGPWLHPRGAMHGLAFGEIRENATEMAVFQSVDTSDNGYPDGLTVNEARRQLTRLARTREPFFLAVGLVRPHLPFGAPAKYRRPYVDVTLPPIPHPEKPEGRTTWHGSGEFMKYNRWKRDPRTDDEFASLVRKHYAACVTYADAQVGRILEELDRLDLRENTIIVLWGDHGWHLGEHAIWGKHSLFEESLRSPLIIVAPEVREAGRPGRGIVETLDIYPTLCDLLKLPRPEFLQGTSLLPQLEDAGAPGRDAIAYTGSAETLRTDRYRLVRHRARKDAPAFVELYDHERDPGETRNIAGEHPDLVATLAARLDTRRHGADDEPPERDEPGEP